jgi:putative membrane protein insertion efficiency factor
MMSTAVRSVAILPIRLYQLLISPLLPANTCKFHPSCSEYAVLAIRKHGVVRGIGLATWRLLRCHPLCAGGHDPVPDNAPWSRRRAARPDSPATGLFTGLLTHDAAPARRADLGELETIAGGFPGRERFLTEITLDPPTAAGEQAGVPLRDEDYLILSTIHSAKGQEWRRVYVLNCVDGCIPSDLATGTSAEIDEERRLFYVAMTRARDNLTLVQPQRFHVHGQHRHGAKYVNAARTRFLPDAILDRFERSAWPPPPPPDAARAPRPERPRMDLAALMRGMWDEEGR